MNFMKRALTSVSRKKAKSIILLILVLVLGNVIIGAISVEQAVKNTEANVRKAISTVATVELNYNEIYENMNENDFYDEEGKYKDPLADYERITPELIEKIGALPQVKYFDYISTVGLESKEVKRYTPEEEGGGPKSRVMTVSEGETSLFSILGGQTTEVLDIRENKIRLLDGRTFTKEEMNSENYPALISKKVADLNDLKVGSVVKLQMAIYKNDSYEVETRSYGDGVVTETWTQPKAAVTLEYEFTIVGIFEPTKVITNQNSVDYYSNMELNNSVYTTNKAVKNIIDERNVKNKEVNQGEGWEYPSDYAPLFILNNPLDLPDFREEVTKLIPAHYMITDTGSRYDAVAAPMKNLEWIASIVLYVALGATLIILSLLITLFLRDRKHEMGIYLSLGEKRRRVMAQILVEVILVSFIGITLSLFSGNLIARDMSEKMLENQLIKQEEDRNKKQTLMGIDDDYNSLTYAGYGVVTTEDINEAYEVKLNTKTILIFYLIGLGAVAVSTVIPNVYILKLNPKKIMM